MALKSQLFRGDAKLEAAAVAAPAHIVPGASGDHVRKIQIALNLVDNAGLDTDGIYGPRTADAVLAYKQKRQIINRSYESQADNIVGVMTMAALDQEVLQRESIPDRRVRIVPKSNWILSAPGSVEHVALPLRAEPLAVGGLASGDAARPTKIPTFVQHELVLSPGGTGSITVIDGNPGKVMALDDPFTGKLVQLGDGPEFSDGFGNRFLDVSKGVQTFTVKAGKTSGSTSIVAQRETPGGLSTASIHVTVRGMLAGRVVAAADGALGFDANQRISEEAAKKFKANNFKFCVRYLSLNPKQGKNDLTVKEANGILSAGLGLMPVQHVRAGSWRPTAAMGSGDGKHAVKHAQDIGFPSGVCVWVDLEDVDQSSKFADVMAFVTSWAGHVSGAGYRPGVYVGANHIPITPKQLASLPVVHYWKSGSNVPDVEGIGYQMVQRIFPAERHFGVDIDRDTTRVDQDGRRAHWLAR
jgi:Domain of unknown function (DUF1906)